ncbi:Uncharacterised protein [Oligella urethralis]|uniref:DpnD/PcfM family protein n=1 Tax=Oligella urethralis TaxID=90245 RepID=UPI000E024027|nr:DpnD/PcfM family protein [Oligella urethralis]SUA61686.1 Uncharacterised protein [Oligella urethralis]
MKKFHIEIREHLQKVVEITAESETDAVGKAEALYHEKDIRLDKSDFIYYEIKPIDLYIGRADELIVTELPVDDLPI